MAPITSIPFIGRAFERRQLDGLLKKHTPSLLVIKGRRRIGKSRLAGEFAKNKNFIKFVGLPPDKKITAQDQRNAFAKTLSTYFNLPPLRADDWMDLFLLLAKQTQENRVIILLDELSWLGSKDPTFLGKLKTVWDEEFKKNPHLILILCSSVSPWMEKNVLSSTGFHGRISLILTLKELPLNFSSELLDKQGFHGSQYEKFLLLSITGGIPWYIELMSPAFTAVENIKNLCFTPDGILVGEFERIFHDLYGKRGPICKKIVLLLSEGPAEYEEIAQKLKYPSGGPLTGYLTSLIQSGFIQKDESWSFKTGGESRIARYRLSDNYLRFYLKFIRPNVKKINSNLFSTTSITSLPAFDAIMGLQFENLVLNNRALILEYLGIKNEDIIFHNPYFQKTSESMEACQIDYLVQTRLGSLFVFEIKFTRKEIKTSVISQVEEKIKRLNKPRNYNCVPILIHMGDVSQSVIDRNYFLHIIDFTQFL